MVNSKIISILSRLFKQTLHIQKNGVEVLLYCPCCKHHKRKLNVNTFTGYYQCWLGCEFKGKSFYSLLRKLKAPKEYYDLLCKDRHVTYVQEEKKKLELPEDFHPLYVPSKDYHYKNALNYCINKRKLTNYDIIRYNVGYCDTGLFRNRIVIPSYDKDNNLNFYSGRDYYSGYIKYRLCDGSKDIIGFESFTNFNYPITIVEGQLDAIAVKYNSIPLFGKSLSQTLKLKLLENKPTRVNVLLDNDALDSSLKICEFLINNNIDTYLIQLPGKDPSELGHKITWETINNSVKMTESMLYSYKLNNKL